MFQTFLYIISRIPFPLWRCLSKTTCYALYWGLPRRRGIIKANIKKVLPHATPSQIQSLALHSWRQMLDLAYHVSRFKHKKNHYLSNTTISNIQAILQSRAKNRGVILISAHTGYFLLAAASLAQHVPVAVVTRFSKIPWINQGMHDLYHSLNLETIERVGGLKPVMRALKQNKVVIMTLDQHAGANGVWASFFNHPARIFSSPARLALKLGCPVHTGFCQTAHKKIIHAAISDALPGAGADNFESGLEQLTQLYIKEVEKFIQSHPESWMTLHNMWKAEHPAQHDRSVSSSESDVLPVPNPHNRLTGQINR